MHSTLSTLAHLDLRSILVVGSLLFACGSFGLMVVHLSTRLKGLGWLGASFASGGLGALLLTLSGVVPRIVSVLGSDLMMMLSFVLLHMAVVEIRRTPSRVRKLGLSLMLVIGAVYVQTTYLYAVPRERLFVIGLAISIQLGQTVILLARKMKRNLRLPSWFTATLLVGLIGMNVFRSVALMFWPAAPVGALQVIPFIFYIVISMGIAFGFFWMTTADLSFELEHMASTDPLTRIYNRRVFREWCEREHHRSKARHVPFSVLMMDLDHFKSINDRFGHQGGDELLCAVVEKMQDSIRGIDVLGRWGGEEFVALLPGANPESALLVAQRVRKNIESLTLMMPVDGGNRETEMMKMTLSLGVATYRGPGDGLDEMLQRADEALYRAKRTGRNRALVIA